MALTTAPDFTDGILTAAKLQQLSDAINEQRPLYVIKAADETVSNSSTLQDDNELVVSVAANVTYRWFADITFQAGTAADFKWAFTFPALATATFVGAGWDTALAFVPSGSGSYTSGSGITYGGAGIGSNRGIILRGTLSTAGTSGTLQFQWAQNTPTVENTVVKAGSGLFLWRLS